MPAEVQHVSLALVNKKRTPLSLQNSVGCKSWNRTYIKKDAQEHLLQPGSPGNQQLYHYLPDVRRR